MSQRFHLSKQLRSLISFKLVLKGLIFLRHYMNIQSSPLFGSARYLLINCLVLVGSFPLPLERNSPAQSASRQFL